MPIVRPEERLGTTLAGKYRLDRIVGRGGMGVVYAGVHALTQRSVAVKLMLESYFDDEANVRRFYQEAQTAASLHHPNVVDVLDMGEAEDGQLFVALEFLEGEPLSDRLEREQRLSPESTLDVLLPIIDALAMVHSQQVLHRDIKPDNIFLSVDGRGTEIPKLLDFGIAKIDQSPSLRTKTGAIIGTPHYMSPEQAQGAKDIGPATDVWAIGVVLYECLSGVRPFEAESVTALLLQVISVQPTPVGELVPECPTSLAAVVMRALARDRATRYADAGELLEALEQARREQPAPMTREILRSASPAPSTPPARSAPESDAPASRRPEPDEPASARAALHTAALGATALQTPVVAGEGAEPLPRDSRGALMAVAAVALLALGGGGLWASGALSDTAPGSPPTPVEPPSRPEAPVPQPSAVASPDGGPGADPAASAAADDPPVEGRGPPETVAEPVAAPAPRRRRTRTRIGAPAVDTSSAADVVRPTLAPIPVDPGF